MVTVSLIRVTPGRHGVSVNAVDGAVVHVDEREVLIQVKGTKLRCARLRTVAVNAICRRPRLSLWKKEYANVASNSHRFGIIAVCK